MDDQIHDIDPATGLSRGIFAVDPSGHLITLGRTQSIKPGFRYATRADVYGAPVSPVPALDPEPAPFLDPLVDASRDADDRIRLDLIEPSPRDQD